MQRTGDERIRVLGQDEPREASRALSRAALAVATPPIRVIHLGLGSFHRAHQAWYTHRANAISDEKWGIASFTGQRPAQALKLAPQDGLYFLVVRSPEGDSAELITSIGAVHAGTDLTAWLGYFRDPGVGLLTLTITEAGYRRNSRGGLDLEDESVKADVAELRAGPADRAMTTAAGKIVQGLLARRAAGVGGMTILSCDNLPHNGTAASTVVLELSAAVDAELAAWVETEVTFPNTMVDRITPRTVPTDLEIVERLTGWVDASPVVTEPFSEWVIENDFPHGAPDWAGAGATVVDDVTPYEQRKLIMLNGGHSLLAYAGSILGHTTVRDAVTDPACVALLDAWWDEAGVVLTFDDNELARYRSTILDRWANPRIGHLLEQIAIDGSQKVPVRTREVIEHYRRRGEMPSAALDIVGSWLAHVRGRGGRPNDVDDALMRRMQGSLETAVDAAIAHVVPDLHDDSELGVRLHEHASRWEAMA